MRTTCLLSCFLSSSLGVVSCGTEGDSRLPLPGSGGSVAAIGGSTTLDESGGTPLASGGSARGPTTGGASLGTGGLAAGGTPSSRGGTATGSTVGTGGTQPSTGGATGTGNTTGTGGMAAPTGGVAGLGNTGTGGTQASSGGQSGTGGSGAGGDRGKGGTTGTGGTTNTGGGTTGTGGMTNTGGGTTGTGGVTSTGGASSTGGSTTGMGGSTGGGSTSELPRVCDEPTPWTVPSTSKVVGSGTAESCTADALKQAATAGGYVTFSCGDVPVTIKITSAIQVGKETVVDGGTGSITLDGGGTTQIFLVPSNNSLSVRNLRFINGKSPAVETDATGIGGAVAGNWRSKVEVRDCTFEDNTSGRGGGAVAVWTGSSLTVVSSRFLRNHSWYGGAIYSLLSPLQVINSEFIDNSTLTGASFADGGAIGTDGASESTDDAVGGKVEICGTTIRNSQGYGNGGAAYIWVYPPDQVIIDRTTVEGNKIGKNSKGNCLGGAMRISNGEIIVKNSSFLSNTSDNSGGAFYLDCAPSCTITNSTFYSNKAVGYGGAIFSGSSSGKISINNATFASNTQQTSQANAFFGSATWVINNSIFYNNGCATAGTGAHVLQQGGSGACISGALAGDPMLSAPADNGGPTFTMLPGAGSAALGAGADCETTDQRGEARNTASCDLGSVEVP